MKFNFQTYTGYTRMSTVVPQITISKSGNIGLNKAFAKAEGVGYYGASELSFDKVRGLIGIRFQEEKKNGAMKLLPTKNGSYFISGTGFLHAFNLDSKKLRGNYEPQKFTDEDGVKMYFIDVDRKI